MNRIHYSINPEIDLTRQYEQQDNFKPVGLWYGFDNDWEKFCHYSIEKKFLRYTHKFKLDISMENVIVLDDPEKIIKLFRENNYEIGPSLHDMDWKKVSQKYSGIEIVHYDDSYLGLNTSCEHDYFLCSWWISRWSIDSGCIWDLSIIKSVEIIEYDKAR